MKSYLWLGVITVLLTVVNMACSMFQADPGITAESQVLAQEFSFEYRVNLGLDCFMVRDCGYRIEMTSSGEVAMYEDKGEWKQVASATASAQDVEELKNLLLRGQFFSQPRHVPSELSPRGGRTVTLTYTPGSGESQIVEVFMDDTQNPFPADFLIFEDELRTFLASKVGLKIGPEIRPLGLIR